MKQLNEDIKAKSFQKLYLLYGDEDFLKKSYKNRLKEAIAGDDTMNFNSFEGKGIDLNEVISLADTMPFFSDRRLLLIENSGWFKQAVDAIVEYLPEIPDTTTIVFVETEVDKRNRLFKKAKEIGRIVDMTRQDSRQLAVWAGSILKKEGKKISSRTMELLLSKTGDDMGQIKNELDKLISYTLGRDVITDEDVNEVCTEQLSNKIFDMVNAIVTRQVVKAMDLYEDLLTLREAPMRILFLIARQFNQLLQVKELAGQGLDKGTIGSKLKLQPFIAGKIMTQSRVFSKEQILSYVTLCVEMEEAVKTGKLSDRLAVELLITKEY